MAKRKKLTDRDALRLTLRDLKNASDGFIFRWNLFNRAIRRIERQLEEK